MMIGLWTYLRFQELTLAGNGSDDDPFSDRYSIPLEGNRYSIYLHGAQSIQKPLDDNQMQPQNGLVPIKYDSMDRRSFPDRRTYMEFDDDKISNIAR